MRMHYRLFNIVCLLLLSTPARNLVSCWTLPTVATSSRSSVDQSPLILSATSTSEEDPAEIVAKRIVVTGDVHGGYYRACVRNEASRFRKLVGTMTPPDESDSAEIYVEGKRKMVDGFVRWCKKGDVGLSQVTGVKEVFEEEPTGLYDDFYVKSD